MPLCLQQATLSRPGDFRDGSGHVCHLSCFQPSLSVHYFAYPGLRDWPGAHICRASAVSRTDRVPAGRIEPSGNSTTRAASLSCALDVGSSTWHSSGRSSLLLEVYGSRWAPQSSKLLQGRLARSWVGSTPIRLCPDFKRLSGAGVVSSVSAENTKILMELRKTDAC